MGAEWANRAYPAEILLVEDDPDAVELTLQALRAHRPGSRVQLARDGAEALDFLLCRGSHAQRRGDSDPTVVLLDLKLPRVDGLEVLRQMRNDVRTRATPVVVLTSSRESPDVARSYELGANSYIVKPVNYEKFHAAIGQISHYWLQLNEPRPQH